jgi:hypothetical protein
MEPLPANGDTVEIYSASLQTWVPATVTSIVDERDVVVHYSVAGARAGAVGVRTKRVDVFDTALMRSIQTGKAFEWRAGGLLGPERAADFPHDRGPYAEGGTPAAAAGAALGGDGGVTTLSGAAAAKGSTNYPKEGDTVETYSVSLQTWIPATVTAVVDERDVVVHYSVAGARDGASGFRTKKVDIFDPALVRDVTTGQCFARAPTAAAAEPTDAEMDEFDMLAQRTGAVGLS